MRRAARPCPTPGCPNLITTRAGQACPTCQARAPQTTAYDARWRTFAASYLARHPRCQRCRTRRATNVHHRAPVAIAPRRRLDPTNVEALCFGCHRAATPTRAADGALPRRHR